MPEFLTTPADLTAALAAGLQKDHSSVVQIYRSAAAAGLVDAKNHGRASRKDRFAEAALLIAPTIFDSRPVNAAEVARRYVDLKFDLRQIQPTVRTRGNSMSIFEASNRPERWVGFVPTEFQNLDSGSSFLETLTTVFRSMAPGGTFLPLDQKLREANKRMRCELVISTHPIARIDLLYDDLRDGVWLPNGTIGMRFGDWCAFGPEAIFAGRVRHGTYAEIGTDALVEIAQTLSGC